MKYVIKPGWITSKNDGERHYITKKQLIALYQVPESDCLDEPPVDDCYCVLAPRYDGNYYIQNAQKDIKFAQIIL